MSLPSMLRPKVTVKKWDASATYFVYSSFSPPASGARVIAVDVEDREMVASPFRVVIEDSGGALDANVGTGNKVTIAIGATQPTLADFVTGYVRHVDVNRIDTNLKEITLHGYSSLIRLDERIGNFYRIADRAANGEDPDPADEKMKCSEIFKDIFEDADHLPVGQPQEPFTTGGVQEVSEKLASIKEPFIEWKQIADRIAEASGAVYGIGPDDSAFLRYPTLTHSGITIRDSGDPGANPDAATGYFVGPWNYIDSIKKADGFANRLYGKGGTQLHLFVDQFTDSDAAECYTVDRAVRFTPHAPRLDSISLVLSRVGTLPSDIVGEVRLDEGGGPAGDIIGSFSIFKDLVGITATTVNRINIAMHGGRIQVDKPLWIILKKQGDLNNHFRWHHDGGAGAVEAERATDTWAVDPAGRAFSHRAYCSRRVLTEASDPASIARFGVIEAVVDAPWIIEGQTMDAYLTALLQYSALQHRIFDVKRIYAPSTLLAAGRMVRLVDSKAGINMDAEVMMSRYRFRGEDGLGTRYAEVQLQAYVR